MTIIDQFIQERTRECQLMSASFTVEFNGKDMNYECSSVRNAVDQFEAEMQEQLEINREYGFRLLEVEVVGYDPDGEEILRELWLVKVYACKPSEYYGEV